MITKPHSDKQDRAIFSNHKITICCTGIQWGKTCSGAMWLRIKISQFSNESNNFIITAPTYKIMQQSTLPEFMSVFKDIGKMNKSEYSFKIDGGGTIYLRTGTEPDSIVGITNVQAIWGDEAGKYSLYFWNNIEARAAFKDAPIMLTTTPYSLNWLYKELIRPSQAGKRTDILLIGAKSIENPYFNKETYYRRQQTMDPRRFNAIYNGNFERMQGLVYDCFDENINVVENFLHPTGTTYFGGIDWGYNDPFVFLTRAITSDGNHFQISEFCKTRMTLSDIIIFLKAKLLIYPYKIIYCDPSQPAYIEELCRNNIPAVGADNNILFGIEKHYELIKTTRFKILKGSSPHTLSEIESYHWPEPVDLMPDQHAKPERPVDQDNHAMDAQRYISIHTFDFHKQKNPFVPTEQNRTHLQPEEIIRKVRRPGKNIHSERWS